MYGNAHGAFELLQAVDESPVEDVEDDKHEWEQYAGTFVDPRGDLLRCHGGPVVLGRLIGPLAAAALLLALPDQLVEALRRDGRKVHRGWEALKHQGLLILNTVRFIFFLHDRRVDP